MHWLDSVIFWKIQNYRLREYFVQQFCKYVVRKTDFLRAQNVRFIHQGALHYKKHVLKTRLWEVFIFNFYQSQQPQGQSFLGLGGRARPQEAESGEGPSGQARENLDEISPEPKKGLINVMFY